MVVVSVVPVLVEAVCRVRKVARVEVTHDEDELVLEDVAVAVGQG